MENTNQKAIPQKTQVSSNVWFQKDKFVNYYFVKNEANNDWFLIDTGLASSAEKIRSMARELFGDRGPKAIIFTHGHFDHTGSVKELAHAWHVPVYAHYLEFPYLSGKSSYPPPDPLVGGGLMSALAGFYKKDPIDISSVLTALPDDGTIPGLSGWRFIHTPGHSPGHISLFREQDRLLIAGDAFVTTKAESLLSVITQKQEISGPPMYFTCDWDAASDSVKVLAALNPGIVACGHGRPFSGEEMISQLGKLAADFYEEAVPRSGRYTDEPSIADASGTLYVPPRKAGINVPLIALGAGILAMALTAGVLAYKSKK